MGLVKIINDWVRRPNEMLLSQRIKASKPPVDRRVFYFTETFYSEELSEEQIAGIRSELKVDSPVTIINLDKLDVLIHTTPTGVVINSLDAEKDSKLVRLVRTLCSPREIPVIFYDGSPGEIRRVHNNWRDLLDSDEVKWFISYRELIDEKSLRLNELVDQEGYERTRRADLSQANKEYDPRKLEAKCKKAFEKLRNSRKYPEIVENREDEVKKLIEEYNKRLAEYLLAGRRLPVPLGSIDGERINVRKGYFIREGHYATQNFRILPQEKPPYFVNTQSPGQEVRDYQVRCAFCNNSIFPNKPKSKRNGTKNLFVWPSFSFKDYHNLCNSEGCKELFSGLCIDAMMKEIKINRWYLKRKLELYSKLEGRKITEGQVPMYEHMIQEEVIRRFKKIFDREVVE
ncbi:MAG: hypothetical protein ABIH49_02085 [archaeon]